MEEFPIRAILHYTLHLGAPFLIALCFGRERRWKAALIMVATMAVDLDHLLADPVFDPNRCSIGFHLLHQYWCIALYALMCVLPYKRLRWPWWLRAVGVGLAFHMLTDWQDYHLWS